MNTALKNSLWVVALIVAVAFLGLFTVKVAATDPDAVTSWTEIEAIVQEHKAHTHEHAGLACCPCGLCHKHNKDDAENVIVDPPIWIRLTALATFVTVMMSAITGMFWC
jgi:ABC-type nickel/cobalt efflux system permease component RcnA